MQIMVDTNVVLDVLLNRTAHVNESAAVLKAASDDIQEFISASAITDIYYIAQKELKKSSLTKQLLRNLLQIVHVSSVSEVDIWAALDSGWEDFEDAVQNSVAEHHLPYQKSTFGRLSIADGKILKMLFRTPLQNITGSTVLSPATLPITAIPHCL